MRKCMAVLPGSQKSGCNIEVTVISLYDQCVNCTGTLVSSSSHFTQIL